MKILQLCKKFPFPLKDGESIAVTYLSKALHQLGCELTLLAMNTTKHYFDLSKLPETFNHYKDIITVDIDNRIKVKDAATNLFSDKSFHVSRFISDEYDEKLRQLLIENDYDIIQLETPYLSPYIDTIRKNTAATIAMRAHNVEHEIWERITDNTPKSPKKAYLKHLTRKLKRFERNNLKNYDILVAITQRDLTFFENMGYQNKGCVAPIGLQMEKYKADFSSFSKTPSISFIGSLDWMPNLEGLQWFLKEVMPHFLKELPDLKLHIAGRNTPKWLLNYNAPNVVVHGEVPDALEFVNQHSISIVPLFSGSGMRAKILEAMALGKVVITTAVGVEGISATDEILKAETKEDFIKQIQYCYNNQKNIATIGRSARDFVLEEYDNLNIAAELLTQYAQSNADSLSKQ